MCTCGMNGNIKVSSLTKSVCISNTQFVKFLLYLIGNPKSWELVLHLKYRSSFHSNLYKQTLINNDFCCCLLFGLMRSMLKKKSFKFRVYLLFFCNNFVYYTFNLSGNINLLFTEKDQVIDNRTEEGFINYDKLYPFHSLTISAFSFCIQRNLWICLV